MCIKIIKNNSNTTKVIPKMFDIELISVIIQQNSYIFRESLLTFVSESFNRKFSFCKICLGIIFSSGRF